MYKKYINNELLNKIKTLRKTKTIYPKDEDMFKAYELTPLNKTKIVILGQDPFHGKDEAHGLSFSVSNFVKMPPSLRNIFKELKSDLGIIRTNTNLTNWAKQGVLLINTILTVEEGMPLSHANIGWEEFTINIIKELNNINNNIVFILWGNNAQNYIKYLNNKNHLIIKSPHPSPLSSYRGFFGSKPFSMANNFLMKHNIKPIDFSL